MNTANDELTFLKRVNKFVMTITIIIDIATVAGYVIAYLTNTYPLGKLIFLLGVMLAGVIASFITMFVNPKAFRWVTMIAFALLYAVALKEAVNDFMFVLVFPIITMYILYYDQKFILCATVIFSLMNIIDLVHMKATLGTFRSGLEWMIPIVMLRLGSVLIYSLAIVGTTGFSNKNNAEKEAKTNALLEIIVPIVKNVSHNSKSLTASINSLSSDLSHADVLLNEASDYNAKNSESIQLQQMKTNEIQNMIADTKNESDKMVELSKNSTKAINEGQVVISQLSIQAKETSAASEQVVASVKALIANSEEIAKLTSSIASIAEQTNLLATNASIESARAGTAGKGFNVISGDIRRLADTTNKLTKSIEGVIEQLNENAKNASETLNMVSEKTTKESNNIAEAERQFSVIETQISQLDNSISSLYTSIDQIMATNEMIVSSMEQISLDSSSATSRTNEAADLGNHCTESAKKAMNMVDMLVETVSQADNYVD